MRTAISLAFRRSLLVLAALAIASCVSRGEIEEIKANQQKILAKLDKVGTGKAPARPQQGARPGRPDPSKVYSIPVGDSVYKGAKDAWATIVEGSEFQ